MPNQIPHGEPNSVADDYATAQKAFIERGLASLAAAKLSGEYYSSEFVLKELDEILASATMKASRNQP